MEYLASWHMKIIAIFCEVSILVPYKKDML